MSVQPKTLKLIALILWGCLIFLIIGNQRINIDYLQKENSITLENSQYQFAERGNDSKAVSKYRIDRGEGEILFGYSQEEAFVSLLSFNFEKPRQIRFVSRFSKTRACNQGVIPDKTDLHLNVNGSEYLLQNHNHKESQLILELSADDQIAIYAQTSDNGCGAVLVSMAEVRKLGDFAHYLLLNILWASFIALMLASGKVVLPLLSASIFYIFQKAELLYSPFLFWEQLLLFSSLAIATSLILSLTSSFYKNSLFARSLVTGFSFLLVLLTCVLPLLVLGFEQVFEVQMNKYDWFAILQTDLMEAFEFVTVFASGDLWIRLITLIVTLLLLLFFSGKKRAKYRSVHWLAILIFCFATVTYYEESNLISKSFAAISEYNEDLVRLEEKAKQRKTHIGQIQADKQRTDEVYIVIIGESGNRNHLSLYGYPRSTNPRLLKRYQNNDLIRFDQPYSCGISTLGSLKYAFTSAVLKKGDPNLSPTIMEVLNRAGLNTYWIHNGSTSVKPNLVGLIGEQALYTDNLSSIYGKEDGKLLIETDKILAQNSPKSKVIFLKTQGSHIDYCNRFPNKDEWMFEDTSFDKWMMPDKYEFTRLTSKMKKCYDGSIKYTDYFVDEIIKQVERTGKTAVVVYFSDHGEEIVEGTAHMGKKPTYGVFSIPMFLWFSESYQQRYPARYRNIAVNATERVFVNDALFDSLLGLMAVNYDGLQPENDISSKLFKDGKYIYRGKKTVYDSDNYIFNTPRNLGILRDKNSPYPVYVGPLEHPFHVTWVTGENRYDRLVLAGIYQEGMFKLDSPLYRKAPVALATIFKYLQPHPEQNIFLRLKVEAIDNNNINTIVDSFLSLIKTNKINEEDLVVASSNPVFLDALKNQNIQVSYLPAGEKSGIQIEQYEAVTLEHNQLTHFQEYLGDKQIDVWISSCDINSCDQKFFKELDKLAEKINIRRVILPMFSL